MPRPPLPRIHAKLVYLPPGLTRQHNVEYDYVVEMAQQELKKLERANVRLEFKQYDPANWTYPPILVCLRNDGTFRPYDGHHRDALAEFFRVPVIPCYLFTENELNRVVRRYFRGKCPEFFSQLDKYIILEDGSTYKESKIRA